MFAKILTIWDLFFPFEYGIGIQKFYMPGISSPLKAFPDMIGHCGSTGTVAFDVFNFCSNYNCFIHRHIPQ